MRAPRFLSESKSSPNSLRKSIPAADFIGVFFDSSFCSLSAPRAGCTSSTPSTASATPTICNRFVMVLVPHSIHGRDGGPDVLVCAGGVPRREWPRRRTFCHGLYRIDRAITSTPPPVCSPRSDVLRCQVHRELIDGPG